MRLLLIEQSLRGGGGHHLDYVRHIVRAAQAESIEVSLATHRKFQAKNDPVLNSIRVYPCFENTTYSPYSDLPGLKQISRLNRWKKRFQTVKKLFTNNQTFAKFEEAFGSLGANRDQFEFAETFARNLSRLHQEFRISPDDSVFFITMSDWEYFGFAKFLIDTPGVRASSWNCQFHFDLFVGRPHEWNSSTLEFRRTQAGFRWVESVSRNQVVRKFTTSEHLAKQFALLGTGAFASLPYPVNPDFKPTFLAPSTGEPSKSLQVTCAGGVRPEKGQAGLQTIVDEVDDLLASGKAKFVVQRKNRKLFRKQQVQLTTPPRTSNSVYSDSWIQYSPFPLPEDQYVRLVRNADIGLLLYDGRSYASRRAGIFGEFLASGAPVICPAGTWMADQLQAANASYLTQLWTERDPRLDWKLDITQQPSNRTWTIDPDRPITAGLLQIRRNESASNDPYLRVHTIWRDRFEKLISSESQVVKCEVNSHALALLVSPVPGALPLVTISSAYDQQAAAPAIHVALGEISIESAGIPLGGVGLSADGNEEVSRLLRNITKHYRHYRDNVRNFAARWSELHAPKHTLDAVIAKQEAIRAVA